MEHPLVVKRCACCNTQLYPKPIPAAIVAWFGALGGFSLAGLIVIVFEVLR